MAMVQEPTGELPVVADAELVNRASAGGTDAFGELYRRHVDAAWRVAHAVTGNSDDAADAVSEAFTKVFRALPEGRLVDGSRFRPYLLAATRNAAVDVLRRTGRVRPTDTNDTLDTTANGSGPSEHVVDGVDRSLVAAAFRSLPERWRSVLWLTEVEGMAPSEAAPLLGVSANGAAQLAVRARAGLRQRFLQAHLREEVAPACRFTVEHLGAYVAGGLSPRDIAKVDQHLAGCPACESRQHELDDLGTNLRRAAIPLPLALAGVVRARWRHALSAGRRPAAGGSGQTLRSLQRPLATASAGLLGMGILGAVLISPDAGRQRTQNLPAAAGTPSTASLPFVPATSTTLRDAAVSQALAADAPALPDRQPAAPPPLLSAGVTITTPSLSSVTVPKLQPPKLDGAVPAAAPQSPPPSLPPATVPSGPPPSSGPAVQVDVQVGGPAAPAQVDVNVGVGNGACNSASAAGIHTGDDCTTPAPPSGPAEVTVSGSAVPGGPHHVP